MASANTVVHSRSEMALRVAFIGGGSGGHLFPAVAIAQELLSQNPESRFLFLTSHRPVDQMVLSVSGVPCSNSQIVPYAASASARGLLNSATQLLSLWHSFRLARHALKSFQPNVVVGLGALASVPGVLAGSRLGLPVVLLEQNSLPGRATRLLSRRAQLTVFGLRVPHDRLLDWPSLTKTCGTPVRRGIGELANLPVHRISDRKQILILGGSQGSESLNRIVATAFCSGLQVGPDWKIVHQTGQAQVSAIHTKYLQHGVEARVAAFLPDMSAELAEAGIVISRAGAVTIQEVACAGIPSILIPLSTAADNHQMLNARLLERIGAAVVIDERNLEGGNTFTNAAAMLLGNSNVRQRMASAVRSLATPRAATDIATILCDVSAQYACLGKRGRDQ